MAINGDVSLKDLFEWASKRFELVLYADDGQFVVRFRPQAQPDQFQFLNNLCEVIRMLNLTTTQKCTVSIQPIDSKGHPAPLDGKPAWTTSVNGIVSLFPSDDGLKCDIVTLAVGSCQISVAADADLSSGVKQITGVLDITVAPAQAVGFQINTGTVVEQ